MDEEDGRPGACSRKFGYLDAPSGVAPQSLFRCFCISSFREFREDAGEVSGFDDGRNRYEKHPSGAKALIDIAGRIGTTEVVPFHESTLITSLRSNTL